MTELQPRNQSGVNPQVARGFDALLSVQRPVVVAHIRSIRNRRPDASPEQIIGILERRYLTAVTTGGALVGARNGARKDRRQGAACDCRQ